MSNFKRFGWIKDHSDSRDKIWTAPKLILATLPPLVDIRKTGSLPPVYNQGDLGSCTANAIAGLCEFTGKHEGHPWEMPSRLFIYYNERRLEGTTSSDSGAELRDGIRALNKWGFPAESLWPYDISKFADMPPVSVYSAATKDIVTQYARMPQDANSLQARLVQTKPVVFGFTVYSSFMSNSVAETGMVPMPSSSDSVEGGHAVLLVGYDAVKKLFIVRNSWGEGWGDNGYCYFPMEYLTNANLASDFWTIYWTP